MDSEIDVGLKFETERNASGQLWIKILHIPPEIDVENMVKNICDLGMAAEEQYRRNEELVRRMLDAKTKAEQQLEEEREKRIGEGGVIWPVWSWITGGKQPAEETQGRAFSVVSDTIKVVEDPVTQIGEEDNSDQAGGANLIKSAFAQKIIFRKKGDTVEVEEVEVEQATVPEEEVENKNLNINDENINNNSETNACSELTEDMTDVNEITEMTEEVNEEAMNGQDNNNIDQIDKTVNESQTQPNSSTDQTSSSEPPPAPTEARVIEY